LDNLSSLSSPPKVWFVTGTDTDVGKTYFTRWLVQHWIQRGLQGVGLKPISCGDTTDTMLLCSAAGDALRPQEITTAHYSTPVTPFLAATVEEKPLKLQTVNQSIAQIVPRFSHVAIEGVGGWLAPLAPQITVREWAQQLGYPVLVVARTGLGTLNHTLLTVESIRAARLSCAGLILNDHQSPPGLARETNPKILAEWTHLPTFVFDAAAEEKGLIPAWLL
jgi:dethiobiotin synthetase